MVTFIAKVQLLSKMSDSSYQLVTDNKITTIVGFSADCSYWGTVSVLTVKFLSNKKEETGVELT